MSGESRRRRRYDKAFKEKAIRMVLDEELSAAEVELRLRTGKGILARWVREFRADKRDLSYPGRLKALEQQIQELKAELDRVGKERDTLMKAVGALSTGKPRGSAPP